MEKIDKNFWEKRWNTKEIGWDVGAITTPLKTYFDQIQNKNLRILIPGCGNAYEAEYLWESGFSNVFVLDITQQALDSFSKRVPQFPQSHLICADFFNHNKTYDLIVEQTFFCALNPHLRSSYAPKVSDMLNPNGKLVGLLFNIPLNESHPPFGGSKKEYEKYFEPYFNFVHFTPAYNSIKPRENNELFILFSKK